MKRFAFRLARLERLRERRKRDSRIALAGALAELRDREREREHHGRELERSNRETLPPALAGDPAAMRRLAAWRDALHRMVVHASMREEEARTEASGKSREYREASREHRVLELLREKRYRRWLEDAELEERKFLDEIHLLRLARSGSGKED